VADSSNDGERREMTLDSGVKVRYGPFPSGLYFDIMARALDEHPDPEPPMKEIKVVDGTEEVEDPDDPDYQQKLKVARLARYNLLGEAALDLCVEVVGGLEQYEPVIERIGKKYATDPAPDDPDDRKVWFLSKYGMSTRRDWDLIRKIQSFSQVEDEEVRRRVEFFRGDVAGAEGDGPDAPGAAEE
jgi:hypothetical protein